MKKVKYETKDIIKITRSPFDWAEKDDLFVVEGYESKFNTPRIQLIPVRKDEKGELIYAPEVITTDTYSIEDSSIKIGEDKFKWTMTTTMFTAGLLTGIAIIVIVKLTS